MFHLTPLLISSLRSSTLFLSLKLLNQGRSKDGMVSPLFLQQEEQDAGVDFVNKMFEQQQQQQ